MNIWLSVYLLGVCVSFISFLNCFNFGFGDEEPTEAHLFFFCVVLAVFWPAVLASWAAFGICLAAMFLVKQTVHFLLTPIPLGERKIS